MSKKFNTSFTRVALTDEEKLAGSIFSAQHLAILQNLRADAAEQKIHLKFNPADMYDFVQQEAFLTGQLELLEYLITTSEEAQKVVSSQQQSPSP